MSLLFGEKTREYGWKQVHPWGSVSLAVSVASESRDQTLVRATCPLGFQIEQKVACSSAEAQPERTPI